MSPEEMIKTITERVRDTANVRVVFGEPVEALGVTIIPVASVKVSGGGGGGKGQSGGLAQQAAGAIPGGIGLGLRITAKPLGYIEVVNGAAKLVPIVDATKVALVGMVVFGLAFMTFAKLSLHRAKLQRAKAHWAGKQW